ncbi:MAG: ribonuclease III [Ruminococcus sp.]|jgi:ribonuclease-3 family protein|nr:ribonuclease III [Ruminococcus sp.]
MNKIISEHDANQYSPLSLAFLGDGVYDVLVRHYLLSIANMPVAKLHSMKIKLACCEFQSKAYDKLTELLCEHELSILKRGRNASGNTIPKHSSSAEYKKATAVECLFGYLYLTGNNDRINEIFDLICNLYISENQDL